MSDYYAQPLSRRDIRHLSIVIRKAFGYFETWWIPVEILLDQLVLEFDDFSYEIVPDDEWDDRSAHADTDILGRTIRIRENVYIRACEGSGRDRMTIAHEIAHYILICVVGVKLYSRNNKNPVLPFNDPEWQAKCLAGELLIPAYKIKENGENLTSSHIAKLCGVSIDAASYQLKIIGGDER